MTTTTTHRRGDTVRCGDCDTLIPVQFDLDGEYVDCPECGNFGYLW